MQGALTPRHLFPVPATLSIPRADSKTIFPGYLSVIINFQVKIYKRWCEETLPISCKRKTTAKYDSLHNYKRTSDDFFWRILHLITTSIDVSSLFRIPFFPQQTQNLTHTIAEGVCASAFVCDSVESIITVLVLWPSVWPSQRASFSRSYSWPLAGWTLEPLNNMAGLPSPPLPLISVQWQRRTQSGGNKLWQTETYRQHTGCYHRRLRANSFSFPPLWCIQESGPYVFVCINLEGC